MIAVRRAAVLAAMVAAFTPAVGVGQQQASDSLVHRIVLLENKVAGLEQRVRALEDLIKADPARPQPVPASTSWRDVANWRRLRLGMTTDQVRAVLGEPDRVKASAITYWIWGDPESAHVFFIDEELAGWEEPPRSAVGGADPLTGGIYLEAQVDDPPVLISAGPRGYPPVLERAGVSGKVVAQFVIDTTGHAEPPSFKVISTTNVAFNEPAAEMVMKSVFRPGRVRGQAVRVQVQQAVSFNP